MTARLTIFDNILNDLKDNLHSGNGYDHTPAEIKRGINYYEDFLVKPGMCFTMIADDPEGEDLSGETVRVFEFVFFIYATTDGAGNTDQIFEMVEDLESFLDNSDHFTYADDTLLGTVEVKEGGTSDPLNTALLRVFIYYERD